MKTTKLNETKLLDFKSHLENEERSAATVEKYLRDVRRFVAFLKGAELDRGVIMEYKSSLCTSYAPRSTNSMLAALNCFLRFLGRHELCVRQLRVQREAYCSAERELTREEYIRLTEAAKRKNNERLNLIIQTICSTGIRVSELKYITVESLERGEATVSCKGKSRRIFILTRLRDKLRQYCKREGIAAGAVFVTRSGAPVSRNSIWRQMKSLCRDAGVAEGKVFPHNLRHLFARTFYGIEKDIAKLADILGHASINTTRIYIVTTGEEHRRKMENMHLII
ncbi:MAG: tyrosine-type recombinase/integrase [Clostridia bacterium]|nr:tyrosine-type recombinase/integrase [Clostridia bacterium]